MSERRKRGRPPLERGTPTSQLCVKLPQTLHDRLCVRALEQGVDVVELVRRAVELLLNQPNKESQNSTVIRLGRY